MSDYAPTAERDTAWWLWNKKFWCRIPYIQTMSVEYLKHFGMPSTGDKLLDQQTANEIVDRMYNIDSILEHHRAGHRISIKNSEDTKIIYELITNHLNAWKIKLEQDFNTRAAPIDDLIALDNLATAVYKHARNHFTQEYVNDILARQMSNTLRVSRSRILKPKQPEVIVINGVEEEPKKPEHNSMADLFLGKSSSSSRGFKWK